MKLHQDKMQEKKIKEGFNNVMNKQVAIEQMVDTTKKTNLDQILKMTEKYNNLVLEYNTSLDNLKNTTLENINRGTNNPYLNKNIRFSNDVVCYVTNLGVAKPYPSYQSFLEMSGKNGCPSSTYIDVKIPWESSYVEGSVIPLSPSLIVGKPMQMGQSCGNEGLNVYASKMVSNPSSEYTGCYSDKSVPKSNTYYASFEECQQYAADNGYKYFGLQEMRSDGKSLCKVYNSPSDFQQYGSVGTTLDIINTWSSDTGSDSNSLENTLQLLGTGQLVIKDSNSSILFNTPPSTYMVSNGLIQIDTATYGANCQGIVRRGTSYNIQQGNATKKVKELCDGKQECSFRARNNVFGDPAGGCYKSFDVVYRCGDNQQNALPRVWENNIAKIQCSKQGDIRELNFFLKLDNNGKLMIVRGASIDDIKEELWSIQSKSIAGLTPNPNWTAEKGKTGVNYLKNGQMLGPGEWIGSPNGTYRLIMEITGDLVIQSSIPKASCSAINGKTYGVTPQSNAVYKLNQVGNIDNLGKIAYVTEDGEINEYSENMLGYHNEYNLYNDYDSYGNTLKQVDNVSKDECIQQCNADGNCAGFVHQSDGSKCFLKNNRMYPNAPKQPFNGSGLLMGVRKKKVLPGTTCKQETVEVDTVQYSNYAKGKQINAGKDCNLNLVSQKHRVEFDKLKNALSILGEDISTKMEEMYSKNNRIYEDMKLSETKFKENIKMYRENINRIRNELSIPLEFNYQVKDKGVKEGMTNRTRTNMATLNSMLSDADLRLLEENYGYILWSILAVGLVSTTINFV